MKKVEKIQVNAVICPKCSRLIWSRSQHDYHSCGGECKLIMVDGGFDYLRTGFNHLDESETAKYTLNDLQIVKLNLNEKQFLVGHIEGSELSKILYNKDKK
jgi:hypothetical protein